MKILWILATIALTLMLMACTNPSKAERVLREEGYTDIQMKGYALWDCSEDDTFADKFEATNTTGNRVQGVVCSGWLKGSTIRRN